MQEDVGAKNVQAAINAVTANGRLAFAVNERSAQLELAAELVERWNTADAAFEWHKASALALAIHGVVEDLDDQTRMAHPAVAEFFGLPH